MGLRLAGICALIRALREFKICEVVKLTVAFLCGKVMRNGVILRKDFRCDLG